VCLNGNCINQACIAEVVLLVDTSQSMGKNWEAVSTSIQKLAAMSPNASFAMVSFPSAKATGCGVPTGASVPMGSNQAGTFFEWFADNNPFGLTPLAEMMTGMSGLAPALFSAGSGTLILLSDGADTCAYKTMTDIEEREKLLLADLEAATTALFTGQGVKTYVIGYNFEGNPAELDAVAKSGGTGKTTYTPAGSEQELTTALIGIAQDIKLCFEQ
jgi:Mg-chelatase subunit ChlD